MSTVRAPRPALGLALITLANLLGGASYPMQKAALAGLEPGMIALLRHLIALPCLWIWMRARGGTLGAFARRDLARVAALGVFAFGLPMLLGLIGVRLASSVNGALLILIEPVMILLFARFLLGERIGAARALAVALGLCGALCIVLEGAQGGLFGGERLLGNLILVVHAALWGLYTPLVRSLLVRHDALAVGTLTIASSLVLLLPYGLWSARGWRPDEHLVAALGWTLALGVCVSFATTVMWVGALRHIEAGRVAPFVFLQPLSGVLPGLLLLDERLSPQALVGGLLVALGCLGSLVRSERRPGAAGAAGAAP